MISNEQDLFTFVVGFVFIISGLIGAVFEILDSICIYYSLKEWLYKDDKLVFFFIFILGVGIYLLC